MFPSQLLIGNANKYWIAVGIAHQPGDKIKATRRGMQMKSEKINKYPRTVSVKVQESERKGVKKATREAEGARTRLRIPNELQNEGIPI